LPPSAKRLRAWPARSILEQASAKAAGSAEDVQAVSILLQRGLPEELARELITYGLQAGRGMQAVRAACDAVTNLLAIRALGDQDALKVGELLLAGKLPVSAYKSLPSLYLKASAAGMEDSEILNDVIIGTLKTGGGIASMDEKIKGGLAGKAADKPAGASAQGGPPAEPPGKSRASEKSSDKKK
jgi:hypothetical protein